MTCDSFAAQYEEQLSSGIAEDSTPLLCAEPVEAASPAMPEVSIWQGGHHAVHYGIQDCIFLFCGKQGNCQVLSAYLNFNARACIDSAILTV